jgi:glycerol uptake facilitator-like aquaporin
MTYSTVQRLASEAIGSSILVATVVGSGIMGETLAGGSVGLALLANAIATGAMLFVLVTVLGPVSGAHFNPIVSGVFALRGEIGWRQAGCYAVAQIGGAIMGTVLAHAMFALPLWQASTHVRTGGAQWLSEAVATFSLLFTILGTLRARPDSVPVAVALAIVAGYWFTASTSFANPAVTLARALTDTFAGIAPADIAGFIAAQVAGGLVAWLVTEKLFGWRPGPAEQPSLSGRLEE